MLLSFYGHRLLPELFGVTPPEEGDAILPGRHAAGIKTNHSSDSNRPTVKSEGETRDEAQYHRNIEAYCHITGPKIIQYLKAFSI